MSTPREQVAAMSMAYGRPVDHLMTWRRMEAIRLQKLGMPGRYSRYFDSIAYANHLRYSQPPGSERRDIRPVPPDPAIERSATAVIPDVGIKKNNSLAPFTTFGKPTCGYYFSRETPNKKVKFGIPPSDLVKWRSDLHFVAK